MSKYTNNMEGYWVILGPPWTYFDTIFPWRPGRMVNAPTPNAKTSVSDVTVMATPACFIVVAILLCGSCFSPCIRGWFSWHWGPIQ